ncbi:polyprenol reductase isoform X2 [Apis mellifera]|uniref:Polyprenal reductase n=1 Tax=Apis mellifera TaxID=7460 RepID=A0A7M7L0E5_APIME|nr:polyprenol reductase isoform X2 [Apis mellifera]|eukprot:XP_026294757.1 polyprenol reductase isoform X2 [Apis mellifera]
MQINIIRILFIFCTIFTGILGLLIYRMESYLPIFLTRTYRYGKYSVNIYEPIIAKTEVPRKWFKHFYIFAAPASSYVLYLVICIYLWEYDISKNIMWILDICLGSFRQPLGTLICIISESEGFVKGSKGNFSWNKITYFHLLCSIIFILSTYAQLKSNFILRKLRKNKDGKINSTIYKIPHDGLFEYVSGALQITEIIIYITLSIILWQSSTFHYVTIWVLCNQIWTATLTHQWYIQTFKNYPKSRKILIPFIF